VLYDAVEIGLCLRGVLSQNSDECVDDSIVHPLKIIIIGCSIIFVGEGVNKQWQELANIT
jgi:hypothetical protein